MHHIEREKFHSNHWYEYLVQISKLSLRNKYEELSDLHDITLFDYKKDLESITSIEAESEGSDGRKRKIVVAHIMGWEEFQLQVFKDENSSNRLQKQLNIQGYVDPDTKSIYDFSNTIGDRKKSVDGFNLYQANKYQNVSWEIIRTKAIETANRLRDCFPRKPTNELFEFLENSPPKTWKINKKLEITVPAGFYLWMVSLKHEAIEHRHDIALIE